jgi:transposase
MSQQIRKIELTNKERQALIKRISQTEDRKRADRLRVIWFKAQGLSHADIANLLNIGINQVTEYLRRYLENGLEAVCQTHYKGSRPYLTFEQLNELKIELITHVYTTAMQAVIWVQEKFQVTYSIWGMQKLLKKLGFTYKKNRLIPSKADPEAQRKFVEWFHKTRQALDEHDRIYFVDAVYVKHNAEVGYAWSELGHPHLIPSNTGRQRYHVLGAYCTQTHEHEFILTEENINQDKLIALIDKLHAKHPEGKVYVVLDNACYNRAYRVRERAEGCGITLQFQPTYSPNLNLIERLWKFMRKNFFKDKYRDTFDKFKEQLRGFFNNLAHYRTELETLLAEHFETLPSNWQSPVATPFSRI